MRTKSAGRVAPPLRFLACLSLAASVAAHAQTTPPKPSSPLGGKPGYTCEAELLLAIRINGVTQANCEHITRLSNGRLAANIEALQHWRVRVPRVPPIPYTGESYFPLDAIPGLRYRMNEATQELQLDIPAAAFLPAAFDASPSLQHAPQVSPGGFFNYDLQTQHSAGIQTSNGLLEGGIFNQLGVGTTTILWQNRNAPQNLARLDTAWMHDDPETMSRFQLGDGLTRAGTWGRAVRFGGIQWRSNFDTQPGFITFPQPSASGMATLPSTVDVYVNNAQRLSQDVQPGPFEIRNVPVITGAGEVQLVVRDLLGRQQVISQPYYASQSLLRSGLSDHSYEIGAVRQDYARYSNHYGPSFVVATHRLGVSNNITRELRAEAVANRQTAGLGGVFLWPGLGTAQIALAASHGPDGNGALFTAGLEHVSRSLSWSAQEQVGSRRFDELGWVNGTIRPHRTRNLRIGFPLGAAGGSLSVNYVNQQYWGQDGTRLWSTNYSRNLFRDFFLSMYATQSLNGNSTGRSLGIIVSHYLGNNTSASAQFNQQDAGNDSSLQVQKNLPEGSGFGYRLLAAEGVNKRQEANGSWQSGVGTYTAGVAQQSGNTSSRLGTSGGIAALGGSAFLSRRIDDSFAVVNAGGYPDVRVYYENRQVGMTDKEGLILIPRLRPYQQNHISVAEEDLPIEARIERRELLLTPALRSGTYAEFPIQTIRGGTLTIVLDDGSFIPSGATVLLLDQEEEYPVGQRGEVFLPKLAASNEVLVVWKGQGCQLIVDLPPASPPLAYLGRKTCSGVTP